MDPAKEKLIAHLGKLEGRRLVIVGDIGLDEYVFGDVRRISPEAPVPILEVSEQSQRLGLAANVAQNVASLGGKADLVAVVGQDPEADKLKELLKAAKVGVESLLVDPSRPTTRKLRVVSGNHHVVRVDYEHRRFISAEVEAKLLANVEKLMAKADALILEDYAKGVLTESCCQALIALSHKYGKPVLLDPNRATPPRFYEGVDLLTPNRDEAIALSGLNYDDLRESEDFLRQVGDEVLKRTKAKHLVMTQGKDGMSLFSENTLRQLPTYARQVFDVTGAGDTVIAALALGWTSGLSLAESCTLANFAAGVVVGKVGSVPCTLDDLSRYMTEHDPCP